MRDDEEQPCPRDSGAVYHVGLADKYGEFWSAGPLDFAAAKTALTGASLRYRGWRQTFTYSAGNRERTDVDTNGLTDAEEDAFWEAWQEGLREDCEVSGARFKFDEGSNFVCPTCVGKRIDAEQERRDPTTTRKAGRNERIEGAGRRRRGGRGQESRGAGAPKRRECTLCGAAIINADYCGECETPW